MSNIDLPVGVSEQNIALDGIELNYLAAPAESAPAAGTAPLLFIHGNTGSCRWWDLVLPIAGRNCYAPDMPNFGLSSHLGTSTIEAYADSMMAFMAALQIKRPVVVAHSLGGAVALSMAARFPNSFSGLVLIDSSPPDGLVTPEEHYPLIELFKTNRQLLTSALASVMPGNTDSRRLDMLVDQAMRMNPASFAGNARALANFNVSEALAAFKQPVMVLWGELDAIVTKTMAEATVAAFPAGLARLEVLPGIGHSVMVEKPDLFGQHLNRFLTKL